LSLLSKLLCFRYIRLLSFLAASGEKENQQAPDPLKVNPVTRPVIDAQLADAFADWFYVSEIAKR
jgi:hypothetical protein